MIFPPSISPFGLLLGPERDDLERTPLEELRLMHENERQRLGLTRTVGIGAGITGALAAGRILLK